MPTIDTTDLGVPPDATVETIDTRKDQLLGLLREVQDGMKSANRDSLTEEEATVILDIDSKLKRLDGLRFQARIRSLESDAPSGEFGGLSGQGKGFLDFSPAGRKRLGAQIGDRMVGVVDGRKALLPAGETVLPIPVLPSSPVEQGKVATDLLSILPVTTISAGAQARYVRQTTRTNAAAAVAPGGLKPTSVYGLTPVDVSLKVYAHLSEPVDRFMIEDANVLGSFIGSELLYGLGRAVEADVINGATGGVNIVGLLKTSGIVVQAFDTDILKTTRAALTTAQTTGYDGSLVFCLSAADWATAELSRAQTGGTFDFPGAPVDSAARRLWGQPVVTVVGLPAKTGILLDRSAVTLYVDRQGARVDWGSPSDTWSKNQTVARAELRADLGVLQPAGIVQIATAATP